MDERKLLAREWALLQCDHERYERSALQVKLAALAVAMLGLAAHVSMSWIAVAVASCWGIEAIFKTYQARLSERLLAVERFLRAEPGAAAVAMQLHSQWADSRPGTVALIVQYVRSALRPTVAFPYGLLLALGVVVAASRLLRI